MEGPVPTRNGGEANQLQPNAMCRNPGSTLLDPIFNFQKNLKIQQLIHITENNCVAHVSLEAVSSLGITDWKELSTRSGSLASRAGQTPGLEAIPREPAVIAVGCGWRRRSNGELILQLADI